MWEQIEASRARVHTTYRGRQHVKNRGSIPHIEDGAEGLTTYAEEIIGDHQCGFWRDRSTTNHMFCFRQILEKKWEYNEAVHQLFIDFKKAYDSVRRAVLYNILIVIIIIIIIIYFSFCGSVQDYKIHVDMEIVMFA